MYERRSVVDGIKDDTGSGTNRESIGTLASAKSLDEFIR